MLNVKLSQVIAYASQNQFLVEKAAIEFFGNKEKEIYPSMDFFENINGLFNEWFIFDYKIKSGPTFVIEYALRNPDKLSNNLLDELKEIIKTQRFEFFEVESIKRGEWIKVYDLYSGERYKIYDVNGSLTIPNQGSFWGRIAFVNKRWQLVGSDSLFFPITSTDRLKKMYLESKIVFTPKDALALILRRSSKKGSIYNTKKPNILKVEEKRKRLKKKYIGIQSKYKITVSLEEVLDFIFNESYKTNFADYITDLIKLGISEKAMLANIQFFNDLWNYFPHKSLKGKAPVEMYGYR